MIIIYVYLAITYSDLVTTIPFENTVDTVDLRGNHLKKLLEYSVSESWRPDQFNGKFMIHVSGEHFTTF